MLSAYTTVYALAHTPYVRLRTMKNLSILSNRAAALFEEIARPGSERETDLRKETLFLFVLFFGILVSILSMPSQRMRQRPFTACAACVRMLIHYGIWRGAAFSRLLFVYCLMRVNCTLPKNRRLTQNIRRWNVSAQRNRTLVLWRLVIARQPQSHLPGTHRTKLKSIVRLSKKHLQQHTL